MGQNSDIPYLHGFSEEEQDRLRKQGRFLEQAVYRNVDFDKAKNILEVGCGVGAQSEILMRRFPDIQLTGIDFNKKQLEAAKQFLTQVPYAKDRYELKEMDAMNMDFESSQFDGAFLCWVLEHVPNPSRVLSEVRRVLRPGARVFLTEVMNSTFFVDPYSPNVWKYWMALNDFQYENGGDPFIGAKLGNLLTSVGFSHIHTKMYTWHLDNRFPDRRKEQFEYWTSLMMSAADQLKGAGYVDDEVIDNALKEMKEVASNPDAVFMYSFMQAEATVI